MPPHQPSTSSPCYAGIGSRQTPDTARPIISSIAAHLDSQGYILRSGGADGADTFFEQAASRCHIFLPWTGFNKRDVHVDFQSPSQEAVELAAEVITGYRDRPLPVRMLLARNMHQVLGPDLESPVEFVVCWTPGGKVQGGTAHAIRLAVMHSIDVYNLATPSRRDLLLKRIGLSKQLDLF